MSRRRMQRGLVYCRGSRVGCEMYATRVPSQYRGSRVGCSNLDCTAQAARLPLQLTLFGSALSESIVRR